MTGTGYAGKVGQQRLNGYDVDWPRGEPLANYTRTMNWETPTMTEAFDRAPGRNPASWKYGLGWTGGTPLQKNTRQIFTVNGSNAWYQDGVGSDPIAARPEDAERWQLDMWITPHGFLKAAMMPGANPKAVWRWELGEMGRDGATTQPEKMTVVSMTVLGKYRVDATINKEHMLQRIHTWVPDPVLGDTNYEHEFTNESFVDAGGGREGPDRLAPSRRMGRQLPGAERQRRPQRVRRHVQGCARQRLRRCGRRSGRRPAGDVPRPRRDAADRQRRVRVGRCVTQQRRRRIQGLRRRRRGAAG